MEYMIDPVDISSNGTGFGRCPADCYADCSIHCGADCRIHCPI